MKRIILSVIAIIITGYIYCQYSNVVAFSDSGERFYLIIDGVKQNEEPETNVKATGILKETCSITIVFENETIPSVSRKLRLLPAGNEFVMYVKRKKKVKYDIKKNSSTPIIQGIPSYLVLKDNSSKPAEETNVIITETTTTTTNEEESPEGISVGVNVNEPNIDVNLNMNLGSNGELNNPVTSTETTTTTTTIVTETVEPNNVYVPNYTGRITCSYPISNKDFDKACSAISSHQHTDKQMETAKLYFDSSCLTVSHIKRVMAIFTFDYTKMKFAKFAYLRVYDINNYDSILSLIENSNYRIELNNFILQNPR